MIKIFANNLWVLAILAEKAFEHIVGKRENAGNQYFLLLPQCFRRGLPKTNINFTVGECFKPLPHSAAF